MGKYGYSNIDSIPEELITVELDVDKKTGETKGFKKPKNKKCTVEENGIQFEVVSKAQRTLTKIWDDIYSDYVNNGEFFYSYYDPTTLMTLCEKKGIPVEGYTHDSTGVYMDAPIADLFWGPQKLDKVDDLDKTIVEKRIRVFVHILMHCCDEAVASELVAKATKKKNGTLHKGRIQMIAHLDLTDKNGETFIAVAKNDADNKIAIEVRTKGINSTWVDDQDLFDSTDLFFGE